MISSQTLLPYSLLKIFCRWNKAGRIIERTEYQDVIDENRERVLANKDYYKLRHQIIEHQFGVLKRQWGFSFTLLKGRIHVMSEVHLLMMLYNLSRMISLLGLKEFKKTLGRLTAYLLQYVTMHKINFSVIFRIRKIMMRISKPNYQTI